MPKIELKDFGSRILVCACLSGLPCRNATVSFEIQPATNMQKQQDDFSCSDSGKGLGAQRPCSLQANPKSLNPKHKPHNLNPGPNTLALNLKICYTQLQVGL